LILFSTLFNKLFETKNFLESVKYIHYYHPYRGGSNPNFEKRTSGKILDLKDQKDNAINFFKSEIIKLFPIPSRTTEIVICCAPSSNKDKISSGIRTLSEKLVLDKKFIDGTSLIVRTTSIPKLSTGGKRDYKLQKDSLSFVKKIDLNDKIVYLIDDIVTSGVTLRACKDLLKENGAREVHCFAIGRTY
jgi:predicted amidophosphoribosyltransferase